VIQIQSMGRRFRLGALLGFPIVINSSFLWMLAIMLLFSSFSGGAAGVVQGLFWVVVAFSSVVLHELGHAVVARQLSVPIKEIELQFFGGAAKMLGMPRSARDEVAIAAAGPAVSFLLGALGYALQAVTGGTIFGLVGLINVFIGLFNLIPALPMDGGRILRAALSRRMGFLPATLLSLRIARWFALAMGLYGLFSLNLWLSALAVVIFFMGLAELAAVHVRGGYAGQTPAASGPAGFPFWMGSFGGPRGGSGSARRWSGVQGFRPPSPFDAHPFGTGGSEPDGSSATHAHDIETMWLRPGHRVRIRVESESVRPRSAPDDDDPPRGGTGGRSDSGGAVEAEYIPPPPSASGHGQSKKPGGFQRQAGGSGNRPARYQPGRSQPAWVRVAFVRR